VLIGERRRELLAFMGRLVRAHPERSPRVVIDNSSTDAAPPSRRGRLERRLRYRRDAVRPPEGRFGVTPDNPWGIAGRPVPLTARPALGTRRSDARERSTMHETAMVTGGFFPMAATDEAEIAARPGS
jgi:hypothetical protein